MCPFLGEKSISNFPVKRSTACICEPGNIQKSDIRKLCMAESPRRCGKNRYEGEKLLSVMFGQVGHVNDVLN